MKVFEWGSGGSTLYYSCKAGQVVSVEHNKKWYRRIKKELFGTKNVTYLYRKPIEKKDRYKSFKKRFKGFSFKNYVTTIDSYENNEFDLISIDGRAREMCICHATPKVKLGGYIILDNADRIEYAPAINKYLGKYQITNFFEPNSTGKTSIWRIV
jgi:hypothetical protein